MSQLFPKSILLHFPSEIYLRRGVGELFPLLVRALHEKEIVAMQFLRGGRVRVTVLGEVCRRGGLRMHNFIANDHLVMESIPKSEQASDINWNLPSEPLLIKRVLGVQ